jgi:hypothetical protein
LIVINIVGYQGANRSGNSYRGIKKRKTWKQYFIHFEPDLNAQCVLNVADVQREKVIRMGRD